MQHNLDKMDIRRICELLFDSAAEGLVVVDDKGQIAIVNPRISELFGYEEQELIGHPVEILIPQAMRHGHIGYRKKFTESPERRAMGVNRNLMASKKDGTTFPVEVSLNHFKIDNQLMIMALVSDITIRRRAEEDVLKLNAELEQRVIDRTRALEESQLLYRLISRNYPNGMISVFDRNLNYIYAEGMEIYKMGITSDQLQGTNFLKRLPEDIKDDIRDRLKKVLDGHDQSFEIETSNGFYMLNAVGLRNSSGEVTQILMVQQNITQLKEAEENIRQALNNEKHLNELKTRFVSMASHEFRTPLTTIMSSITLLAKYASNSETSEKQNRHIDRIRSSVHHLTDILNDFLSIDKLEEGKIELHPSPINIPQFSQDLADEMQESAGKSKKIKYQHQGEEVVVSDRQMLRNILNNLLSNAVKYSPENSRIDFSTKVKSNELTLEVTDQGIGIPEEEQKHLFERFFRAKNALNIEGTGLGLNIVKKYVDLVDGKINFRSEYEKGSRFTVTLPLNKTTVLP